MNDWIYKNIRTASPAWTLCRKFFRSSTFLSCVTMIAVLRNGNIREYSRTELVGWNLFNSSWKRFSAVSPHDQVMAMLSMFIIQYPGRSLKRFSVDRQKFGEENSKLNTFQTFTQDTSVYINVLKFCFWSLVRVPHKKLTSAGQIAKWMEASCMIYTLW